MNPSEIARLVTDATPPPPRIEPLDWLAGEAWAEPVDLTPLIDRLRAGGIDVNVARIRSDARTVDCATCEGPSEVVDFMPVPDDHKLLRLACGHLVRA